MVKPLLDLFLVFNGCSPLLAPEGFCLFKFDLLSFNLGIFNLNRGFDFEIFFALLTLCLQLLGFSSQFFNLFKLDFCSFDYCLAILLFRDVDLVLLLDALKKDSFLFYEHLGVVNLLLFVDGIGFELQ